MNNLYLKLNIKLKLLIAREEGQDMIEYVLAAALISLGTVAGTGHLAAEVLSVYANICARFTAAVN